MQQDFNSAPAVAPLMWSDQQVADAYNMSLRSLAKARAAGLIPRPIAFGPRLLRWSAVEITEAIAKMPRLGTPCLPEPAHLRGKKAAKKLAAATAQVKA